MRLAGTVDHGVAAHARCTGHHRRATPAEDVRQSARHQAPLALVEQRRHEGEELLESLLADLHPDSLPRRASDRADSKYSRPNLPAQGGSGGVPTPHYWRVEWTPEPVSRVYYRGCRSDSWAASA